MKIGLTFDLRERYLAEGYGEIETAEFDAIETIEGIEGCLQGLGYGTERIGTVTDLVRDLAGGKRWDLVFNIAEGIRGVGREAQVPALLDAYRIPYTFSDPLVLALSLHKGMAKHVFRSLGLPTAPFAVIESEGDIAGVDLPMPLFVKPAAEGTSKGIDERSLVDSAPALTEVCLRLLAEFGPPVLVEEYLSGREYTVGIAGTGSEARALGVMEVTPGEGAEPAWYHFTKKKHYREEQVRYSAPPRAVAAECSDLAFRVWRGLGCRDAGRVDLRTDATGSLNVIEVNPLPGLHPVDSDLPILARMHGIDYTQLIALIVESALARQPDYRLFSAGR